MHESREDDIPYLIHAIRDTLYNTEFVNFDLSQIAKALTGADYSPNVG